jgi:hypothetical protein
MCSSIDYINYVKEQLFLLGQNPLHKTSKPEAIPQNVSCWLEFSSDQCIYAIYIDGYRYQLEASC